LIRRQGKQVVPGFLDPAQPLLAARKHDGLHDLGPQRLSARSPPATSFAMEKLVCASARRCAAPRPTPVRPRVPRPPPQARGLPARPPAGRRTPPPVPKGAPPAGDAPPRPDGSACTSGWTGPAPPLRKTAPTWARCSPTARAHGPGSAPPAAPAPTARVATARRTSWVTGPPPAAGC